MEQLTTEQVPTETKPKGKNWASDLTSRMGVAGELLRFMWKVKLWWLVPMILVLLAFGVIFILGAASPLAPFIYSLH
jgi:Family of unknown function (DUF5989)